MIPQARKEDPAGNTGVSRMKSCRLKSALQTSAVLFTLLTAGCSPSPSELVLRDFKHRQYLTGEELKQDLTSSGSTEEKEYCKDWTDERFEREAKNRRALLIAAGISVESEEIAPDGKTALVRGVISYRDNKKRPFVRELVKNEKGKWRLLPEGEELPAERLGAEKEEESAEETGPAEGNAEESAEDGRGEEENEAELEF